MSLENAFNKAWYGKGIWTYLFYPLKPLVTYLVTKKRQDYLNNKNTVSFPVPIIVVGNITVGGTGKSPMVVALVKLLQESGYHPGIVSRGYGVQAAEPISVSSTSLAEECGDEPVMLAKRTACPLVICQNRVKAVQHLLTNNSVDVVVSDDGMQHYALNRDIEVLMLDADRGLGNGQLLPIGPLREPVSRLATVDFIASVVSSEQHISAKKQTIQANIPISGNAHLHTTNILKSLFSVPLSADCLININTDEKRDLTFLKVPEKWQVIAGIGNPQRFLNTLLQQGMNAYESHWFADHYNFQLEDIPLKSHVIMTEKDAVKCRELDCKNPNLWYLSIAIDLPDQFKTDLLAKLQTIRKL